MSTRHLKWNVFIKISWFSSLTLFPQSFVFPHFKIKNEGPNFHSFLSYYIQFISKLFGLHFQNISRLLSLLLPSTVYHLTQATLFCLWCFKITYLLFCLLPPLKINMILNIYIVFTQQILPKYPHYEMHYASQCSGHWHEFDPTFAFKVFIFGVGEPDMYM